MLIVATMFLACAKDKIIYEIREEEIAREVDALMSPTSGGRYSAKKSGKDVLKEYEELMTEIAIGKNRFERDMLKQLGDLYLGVDADKTRIIYRMYTDLERRRQRGADLDKAISLYKNILEKYPLDLENDSVYYHLAHAYFVAGDVDKTKETLEELLEKFPASKFAKEVNFRLAEIYFDGGDMKRAIAGYVESISEKNPAEYFQYVHYKLGWSYFNQRKYNSAANEFLAVLDVQLLFQDDGRYYARNLESVSMDEKNFVKDAFKGIALSATYLTSVDDMKYFFAGVRELYADNIYKKVAELYKTENNVEQEINVYNAYIEAFPLNTKAPFFKSRIIQRYSSNNLIELANKQRKEYVELFGPESKWYEANLMHRRSVERTVKKIIDELGRFYHATAQSTSNDDYYQQAFSWYRKYLILFPKDVMAPKINLLLAEALFESGNYVEAAGEYGVIAYGYKGSASAEDSAYAAVYAMEKAVLNSGNGKQHKAGLVNESIRFLKAYPQNDMVPDVVMRVMDMLFKDKQYWELRDFATTVQAKFKTSDRGNNVDGALAFMLYQTEKYIADSYYNAKSYSLAFDTYISMSSNDKLYDEDRQDLLELSATSLYKLAQQLKESDDTNAAFAGLINVYKYVPASKVTPIALFDLFTLSLNEKELSWTLTALKILLTEYESAEYLVSEIPDMMDTYLKQLFNAEEYDKLRLTSGGIASVYDYSARLSGGNNPPGWFFYEMDKLTADSLFKEERYIDAFYKYKGIHNTYDLEENEELPRIRKLMASSLYKEGEKALKSDRPGEAALYFIKIYEELPDIEAVPAALFKSGEIYLDLKDLQRAEEVFRMLAKYPSLSYGTDLLLRIANSLEDAGEKTDAAEKYSLLGTISKNNDQANEALYRAAILYEQEGIDNKAYVLFIELIGIFANDIGRQLDVTFRAAELAENTDNIKESFKLYKDITLLLEKPETDREKFMFAIAYFKLAERMYETYSKIKLVEPLEKNLEKKKKMLTRTLKLYAKSASLNVAHTATRATYKAGRSLGEFALALLNSQQPKGLTKDQLKVYKRLMNKKVRPYKKKAVKTFQSNIMRTWKYGTYDEWIKKSYADLSALMPSRYAKTERTELVSRRLTLLRVDK